MKTIALALSPRAYWLMSKNKMFYKPFNLRSSLGLAVLLTVCFSLFSLIDAQAKTKILLPVSNINEICSGNLHFDNEPMTGDTIKAYRKSVDLTAKNEFVGESGTPFVNILEQTMIPEMDRVAKEGYQVRNGKALVDFLNHHCVSKIQGKILRDSLGNDKSVLEKIGNKLSKMGPLTNNKVGAGVKSIIGHVDYDLVAFIALASGSGVGVKIYEGPVISDQDPTKTIQVAIFNGHTGYDPFDENPEQTGRSFSWVVMPDGTAKVDDISHANMANWFQRTDQSPETYGAFLELILKGQSTRFKNLTLDSANLVSNFFTVYVAEQRRRMFSRGWTNHTWDQAVYRVFMLSAYYANLKNNIRIMYADDFFNPPIEIQYTNEVKETWAGEDGIFDAVKARLEHYYHRSEQADPKGDGRRSRRGGFNLEKDEMTVLLGFINQWQSEHNPQVVKKVAAELERAGFEGRYGNKPGQNVVVELEGPGLSTNSPRTIPNVDDLIESMVEYVRRLQIDGPAIDQWIYENQNQLLAKEREKRAKRRRR